MYLKLELGNIPVTLFFNKVQEKCLCKVECANWAKIYEYQKFVCEKYHYLFYVNDYLVMEDCGHQKYVFKKDAPKIEIPENGEFYFKLEDWKNPPDLLLI